MPIAPALLARPKRRSSCELTTRRGLPWSASLVTRHVHRARRPPRSSVVNTTSLEPHAGSVHLVSSSIRFPAASEGRPGSSSGTRSRTDRRLDPDAASALVRCSLTPRPRAPQPEQTGLCERKTTVTITASDPNATSLTHAPAPSIRLVESSRGAVSASRPTRFPNPLPESGRGQARPGPSHTTRHAGPHRAVRSAFHRCHA